MSFALAGILVGVILAGWYGFERQREVFEQLVQTLEHERDEARNEAKVFRGLLFPAIARKNEDQAPKKVDAPIRAGGVPPRGRMPFRKYFNLVREQTNKKQLATDALAAAITEAQEAAKHS